MADIEYHFDITTLNNNSQRHLIRLVAGIFVLISVLTLTLVWLAQQGNTFILGLESATIGLQLAGLTLAKKDRHLLATARIIIYSSFLSTMLVIFTTTGIFSTLIFFLPLYPMLSIILLEKKEALSLLSMQIAGLACMGWLQITGYAFLAPPTLEYQIITSVVVLVLLFLFVTATFHFTVKQNGHLAEKILTMANYDYLTEVLNRRAIDNKLAIEIQRAKRDKSWLTVLMIDVDYFKLYNDQHGHLKGDSCLQIIAHTIQENLRNPPDYIGRYGGEEFLLILPNTPCDSALNVAERIQQSIKKQNLGFGINNSKNLTVTIGIVTSQLLPDDSPELLVNIADKCLYQGKADGRDRIVHMERNCSQGKPDLQNFTKTRADQA